VTQLKAWGIGLANACVCSSSDRANPLRGSRTLSASPLGRCHWVYTLLEIVNFTSCPIVAEGGCALSLNIGPLPAALTALPLPRSGNYEISSTAGAGPSLAFVETPPFHLAQCVTPGGEMRHNTLSSSPRGDGQELLLPGLLNIMRWHLWPRELSVSEFVSAMASIKMLRRSFASPQVKLAFFSVVFNHDFSLSSFLGCCVWVADFAGVCRNLPS